MIKGDYIIPSCIAGMALEEPLEGFESLQVMRISDYPDDPDGCWYAFTPESWVWIRDKKLTASLEEAYQELLGEGNE